MENIKARGLEPMRCVATSRNTGKQCRKYALVGGTVCEMHIGRAPNTVKNAEVRLTLAQLLQSDRRPIDDVLFDAIHNADAIMRMAKPLGAVRAVSGVPA